MRTCTLKRTGSSHRVLPKDLDVLKKDGGNRIIEIVASDATYWMDIDRKTRCFQNIEKTVSEVIAEIMKGYGESDSLCNIPDRPIGELIFQYEETDWEFLIRMASHFHSFMVVDSSVPYGRAYFGIPDLNYGVSSNRR